MAIRIDGAQDDGNGLTVLQVHEDGTVTAPVAEDGRDVAPADEDVTGEGITISPVAILEDVRLASIADDTNLAGLDAYTRSGAGPDHTLTQIGTPIELTPDTDEFFFLSPGGGSNLSARVCTAAPLPAYTAAGAGVGKTLTGDVNAALTVDGVLLSQGDSVLVNSEVDRIQNGLYDLTTQGDAEGEGTAWVLTRNADMDEPADVGCNAGSGTVGIQEGDTFADFSFVLDGPSDYAGPFTLDGVEVATGDRILFKGRDAATNNSQRNIQRDHGVYDVIDQGADGIDTPWILRRAADWDETTEAVAAVQVNVTEGAENADTSWISQILQVGEIETGRVLFHAYDPDAPTSIDAAVAVFSGDVSVAGDLDVDTINGEAYPPAGGGGATLLGGHMVFSTAGTGILQNFSGLAFPFVNATPATAVDLTAVDGGYPVPAGTLRNLRAKSRRFDEGDSSQRSFTATVYVNGEPTSLTISSTGDDSDINDPVVDAENEVEVVAGDHVQIVLTAALSDSGGTPSEHCSVMASVELTPA